MSRSNHSLYAFEQLSEDSDYVPNSPSYESSEDTTSNANKCKSSITKSKSNKTIRKTKQTKRNSKRINHGGKVSSARKGRNKPIIENEIICISSDTEDQVQSMQKDPDEVVSAPTMSIQNVSHAEEQRLEAHVVSDNKCIRSDDVSQMGYTEDILDSFLKNYDTIIKSATNSPQEDEILATYESVFAEESGPELDGDFTIISSVSEASIGLSDILDSNPNIDDFDFETNIEYRDDASSL